MSEVTDSLHTLAESFCARATEMGADSITVAITAMVEGKTVRILIGSGNIYARRGLMQEAITRGDEADRAEVRSFLRGEDDDNSNN